MVSTPKRSRLKAIPNNGSTLSRSHISIAVIGTGIMLYCVYVNENDVKFVDILGK